MKSDLYLLCHGEWDPGMIIILWSIKDMKLCYYNTYNKWSDRFNKKHFPLEDSGKLFESG